MNPDNRSRLEQRVVTVAEALLEQKKYVSPIDVLVWIQWLPQSTVDRWRQGRLPFLERGATANLKKLSAAMHIFRSWAVRRGLKPSATAYVAFQSRSAAPSVQRQRAGDDRACLPYALGFACALGEEAERLAERQSRSPDLVVISPRKDWTCSKCGGSGDLLHMEETGPACLACAELDHLVFLGSGDATLTRRAKQASTLSAVVVRWSRARKRYERQGPPGRASYPRARRIRASAAMSCRDLGLGLELPGF